MDPTTGTSEPAASPSAAAIASRIGAAVLGGYAFVWGVTTLGIALGLKAGLPYPQAQTLMQLLAFLVYLAAFCWAFTVARVGRAWLVLAGGGVLMTGLAWLLLSTS